MYLRAPRPRLRANLRHLGNPRGILRSRSCRSIARARTQGVRPPLLRQPRALWKPALERAPHLRRSIVAHVRKHVSLLFHGNLRHLGNPCGFLGCTDGRITGKTLRNREVFQLCDHLHVRDAPRRGLLVRRGEGSSRCRGEVLSPDTAAKAAFLPLRRGPFSCRCGKGCSPAAEMRATHSQS